MYLLNFVYSVESLSRGSSSVTSVTKTCNSLVAPFSTYFPIGTITAEETSHARVSSRVSACVLRALSLVCVYRHARTCIYRRRGRSRRKCATRPRDTFRHRVSGADPFRPSILFDSTLTHFMRTIVSRTFIAATIVASNDREGGGLCARVAFVEFVNP